MQAAFSTVEPKARKFTQTAPPPAARDFASEEVYAYVAARDSLLSEAEENPSAVTVQRARQANDFVANCLRPPSVPYGAQFLSEQDSIRELQRCRDVSVRLAQLDQR